tara:strand:- start:321 stop:491 length:171 start_codon:yes stop_codon:yes gene_type:complete
VNRRQFLRKKHLKEKCDQYAGKKKFKPKHSFIVFLLTFLGSLATIAVLSFIVGLFL